MQARDTVPLEYISHSVMPYDQASVFSLYVGDLLVSVSRVSGANHFIGTDVCHNDDIMRTLYAYITAAILCFCHTTAQQQMNYIFNVLKHARHLRENINDVLSNNLRLYQKQLTQYTTSSVKKMMYM